MARYGASIGKRSVLQLIYGSRTRNGFAGRRFALPDLPKQHFICHYVEDFLVTRLLLTLPNECLPYPEMIG
jgi:hypothetical protein